MEIRGRRFAWGERTYIVGIVNATPDSFSGDGVASDPAAAAALAREFEAAGADLVDIGGESSRPGAAPVDEAEELRRLVPAVEAVRAATNLPISADTWRARVADAALSAGADAVNDIHGLRADPAMPGVVARAGAALIAMHNQRGRPAGDPVALLREGFASSIALARTAGVPAGRIILDPGFGFGWTAAESLAIIRRLPELWRFEMPLLVGPSRKSAIGQVLGTDAGDRLEGTLAAVALSIVGGADLVRVHDVMAASRAARVADAIARGPGAGSAAPIVIGLGSNLGDRAANLRSALALLLSRGVAAATVSGAWETESVPPGQPPYLNAAAIVLTELDPSALLAVLKQVEAELGRRSAQGQPRPIDLDLLFFGDVIRDDPGLTLPHPRVAGRAFVLAPLAEILPGRLPVLGRSALELLAITGLAGCRRTALSLTEPR